MNKVAILDFGSQVTQLIARRFREFGVYCELFPYDVDIKKLEEFAPSGIVLSGGASSVYDDNAPIRDLEPLLSMAPTLGICYGMQLICHQLGGQVKAADNREYGLNQVRWKNCFSDNFSKKLAGNSQKVWMSHGDFVEKTPANFELLATSEGGHPAAIRSDRVWAVQFHPEVTHTEFGSEILKAFLFDLCKIEADWQPKEIVSQLKENIQKQVGDDDHVLLGISGGVDSSVVASLLTSTLGPERVHCVFVNNGLLRKNEYLQVLELYKGIGLNVHGVDAEERFLSELRGISDPEKKRKTIGRVFIEVFDQSVKDLGLNCKFLAQGTLYPDVIESVSLRGSGVTIKSHHNVGGLPEKMNMSLVEPLRELFKDEVRAIGRELGLPSEVLMRHPFPGPGLAVRILGDITREKIEILQNADNVFISSLKESGLYDEIWQAFVALLPVQSVGVQGDGRSYERACVLRAVTSQDGMTADWFDFPPDFMRKVSNRITNEVKGINRVVYDITSKPPGTIEWE
ncbi:MAG: glutamine-hydrolyzing GMP synthase [Bdellovibrionales bacterium]